MLTINNKDKLNKSVRKRVRKNFSIIFVSVRLTRKIMGKVITNQARFVLDIPNAENSKYIFLICRSCVPRLRYSTGKVIEPDYWDSDTQRPTTQTKGFKRETKERLKEIDTHLSRMADAIERINSRVKAENIEPTQTFYRAELDKVFNRDKPRKVVKQPENFHSSRG